MTLAYKVPYPDHGTRDGASPVHHLRAAGVSAIIDARGPGAPLLLHWGRDLGDLSASALRIMADAATPSIAPSALDTPFRLSLLPTLGQGWTGKPGIELHLAEHSPTNMRRGRALRALHLDLARASLQQPTDEGTSAEYELAGVESGVGITVTVQLTASGILRIRQRLRNSGSETIGVRALAAILPVPARAAELFDLTGIWTGERRPIRRPFEHGVHQRASRHGRGGHDNAYLLAAGVPGFGFRHGEIWSIHVAWSGDTDVWAERSALGPSVIGGAELLAAGEISLATGESYETPWLLAAYSPDGFDGISDRFHDWTRSWSTIKGRPRPATLNTWEAVYFEHSLERLEPLIDTAGKIGVERFVLDDGWFRGRRDDRRGLGDWTVDKSVWPSGLHPLVECVHANNMEFGLWVEPEMINQDSDLAREHPEWILGTTRDAEWRNQRVLDLNAPGAANHLFDRIDELLQEYPIRYLKWDHNRDLLTGSTHRQTRALYALLDRLRAAHPAVEIETCASGGGRIDLGILERIDRVWPSDTNDPVERTRIHWYSGLIIPPEYLGAHLAASHSHTTGRTSELSFRLATSLFGSAGIEWDLTRASEGELSAIAAWLNEYRRLRSLLHSGRVVRADPHDPAQLVHGVVARDRSHAIFNMVVLARTEAAVPPSVRLPGLDPEMTYLVRRLKLGEVPTLQIADPLWYKDGGVRLPGRLLMEVGLPMPLLRPENALVLELTAE